MEQQHAPSGGKLELFEVQPSITESLLHLTEFFAIFVLSCGVIVCLIGSFLYMGGGDSSELERAKSFMISGFAAMILSVLVMIPAQLLSTEPGLKHASVNQGNEESVEFIVKESTILPYEKTSYPVPLEKGKTSIAEGEAERHYFCQVADSQTDHVYYSLLTVKNKARTICNQFQEGMNQNLHYTEIEGHRVIAENGHSTN